MFKPTAEYVFRAILIAAIMISIAAPGLASAKTSTAQDVNPLATLTETPTTAPTIVSTPTVVPSATATSVPTETTTPEVTPTTDDTNNVLLPEDTSASSGVNQAPTLVLSADPSFITPDGMMNLRWSVDAPVIDGLVLQILFPDGVSLQGDHEGIYDETNHNLSISLTSLNGTVQLRSSNSGTDVTISATLFENSEPLANADLLIPAHEQFVLDNQGGEIAALDGKVKVKIPKNVLHGKTTIDIGIPSGDAIPSYSLSSEPFEINATDQQSNTDLHQFDDEIEIDVNYENLDIPAAKLDNLNLYWYNPNTQEWETLSSSLDATAKIVRGFTRHFSVFAVGINQWQAANPPTIDDFQVSDFTGAASFSLPIDVPAGPGGLQPNLTLSYNSQIVDQSTTETQASWVGMGWSLETGSIVVDTGDSATGMDDTYFLDMAGVSTRLVRDNGLGDVYHAATENFWKYVYDRPNNIWTIWDKVGNIYYFELVSQLYQRGDCDGPGTGGETPIPYQWSLTRVRNKFGQELHYTYGKETKGIEIELYSDYMQRCKTSIADSDTATFPESIVYPNGRYRIYFQREDRFDYKAAYFSDATHHQFERSRLKDIYIQQDSLATGFVDPTIDSSQTIRRYEFTYETDTAKVIFPGYTYSAGGKVSTLSKVQEFGFGGAVSLPAHTFTYLDKLHLTKAENGYGGAVEFDYDTDPNNIKYEPWYYDQGTIKNYTVNYDFGTQNQCNPAGWGARNTSDVVSVNCSGSDPYLNVNGTAINNGSLSGALLPPVRPGGIYKYTTSAGFGTGVSVQVGGFAGTPGGIPGQDDILSTPPYTTPGSISYNLTLPADASTIQLLIKTSGGNATFANFKVQLLPSFYRVMQKRVSDGNGNSYVYSYSYANPAVNDSANSAVCAPNQTGCTSIVEAYSEYRGNGQVTETDPYGQSTITTFFQGDRQKGMRSDVTVKDPAGKKIAETLYSNSSISLPMYVDPNYTYMGYGHYWVYPSFTENRIYQNDDVTYSATGVAYTYDTSAATNYTYGDLLTQTDQSWDSNNSTWHTYRITSTDYFPNVSIYLVGLPARQQLKDALGTVVAETQMMYDSRTVYSQPPTVGCLRAIRTWIDGPLSTGRYSQTGYDYDEWGNRKSVTTYSGYGTSGSATTTTTIYDPIFHTYPISQISPPTQNVPLGLVTTWGYDYDNDRTDDYIFGVPTRETDSNGNSVFASYDPFGRMSNIVRPGDSSPTIQMDYNDKGQTAISKFITSINQKIDGSRYYMIKREYDGMGRQTKMFSGPSDDLNKQSIVKTNYFPVQLDQDGNPLALQIIKEQSEPYSGNEIVIYTTTTVDKVAHTTTITAPDGTSTITKIDGLVTTTTDANGHDTKTTKDLWGRVSIVEPATGPAVGYIYDIGDRVTKTIRGPLSDVQACLLSSNCPASKTISLTYDNAGRKLNMRDPDMGYWQYAYDALGNLTDQTDAKSCKLHLTYDSLNRLTNKATISGCSSSMNNSYSYDEGTNGLGFRTSMTDASGSTSWTYDSRGRIKEEFKTIDTQTYKTAWTYNSADLADQITYPDGEVVTNTYDDRMLMDKLSTNINGQSNPYDYVKPGTEYDSAGRMRKLTLGNDLIQSWNYYDWDIADQGGRLKNITVGPAPYASLVSLNYSYDAVGNINEIIDDVANEKQTYRYDSLDRLRCWGLGTPNETSGCESYNSQTDQFGSLSASDTEYQYDLSTGNLTAKDGLTLSYNDAAHVHAATDISGVRKFWYDDNNGNQTKRTVGSNTYDLSYDAENHLIGVTGPSLNASFTYDGDGRRVKSVINGVTKRFANTLYETEGEPTQVNTSVAFQTNSPALPNAVYTQDNNWGETRAPEFPATNIGTTTTAGTAAPHTGPTAYAISNQAYGSLSSDAVAAIPGSQYTVSFWVRSALNPEDVAGGWLVRVYFYDSSGANIGYQNVASGTATNTAWTQKSGTVTAPTNSATQKVILRMYMASGWVAYDDVSLIKSGTSTNLIANPGFESASNWTATTEHGFLGTGFWRSTSGTAAPHGGAYSYVISNQMYGNVLSDWAAGQAGSQYDVSAWVRGAIDDNDAKGSWLIRDYFYNSSRTYIGYQDISAGGRLSATWTNVSKRITAPANTAYQRLWFISYLDSGWYAFDDASVIKVGTSTNLILNPGFETETNWVNSTVTGFPATGYLRGTGWTTAPHTGSYAYAISNQGYGNITSLAISVTPNTQYDVSAWVRGQLDPATTIGGMFLRALYYDANGQLITYNDFAYAGPTLTTTWQQFTSRTTAPANAATMRLQGYNYLAVGWVAFDDFTVVQVGTTTNLVPNPDFVSYTYDQQLSNSITVNPNTNYSLSALVKGNGGTATGNWAARIHYYDSSGNLLPEYKDIGGSNVATTTGQAIGGQFTTPTNATVMRIAVSSELTSGSIMVQNVSLYQAPDATKYYFAGTQRIAMRVNGTLSYILSDHLGSTSITTDTAGAKVSEMRYKPWGEVRYAWTPSTSTPLATPYTFTGQYSYMDDPTTSGTTEGFGLLFYNARMYDPVIGRFTSADSIVPSGTQGLDRYAYVSNNPLRYTDPSGHCIIEDDGKCHSAHPAKPFTDVPLSPEAQDLIDFAKIVHKTPEEVIAIGLGHEWGAFHGDDLDYAGQHVPNRFVDWARTNCHGQLTHNCMLNFFMKQYQSVQCQVYDCSTRYGRSNHIHSKYWDPANTSSYSKDQTWTTESMDFAKTLMKNFWSNIDPNYDPVTSPNLAFDTGVYLADDLTAIFGRPLTTNGTGILAMVGSRCKDGTLFYSVVVSWTGYDRISDAGTKVFQCE